MDALSSCLTPEGNTIPLPSSAVDVTVGRRSRRTSTSYTRAHQVLWLSEDKAQESDRAEVRSFDGARICLQEGAEELLEMSVRLRKRLLCLDGLADGRDDGLVWMQERRKQGKPSEPGQGTGRRDDAL